MRIVCGLDVHKDSVFACILNENGDKFECKFGVLTPELERLSISSVIVLQTLQIPLNMKCADCLYQWRCYVHDLWQILAFL